MKKYAVIMEINPFHNGHLYFLNEVKKIAKNDPIICIISTNYVQRGELSVLDKKSKVQLLLDNHVDIVLELPMLLANQGGEHFAFDAVRILNEFDIDYLCFGSESNDLDYLYNASNLKPNKNFSAGIHNNLNQLKSNDILAISYLKAINKINLNIKPITIKRIENNYNDSYLSSSNISSATSIRENIKNPHIINFLPLHSFDNIVDIDNIKLFNIFLNNLCIAIENDYKIFLAENNQILYYLKTIIDNNNINSIGELVEVAKNKNNSKYKLKRIILNTCLLITDNEATFAKKDLYIRVLGINKEYFYLLKNINNYFTNLYTSTLRCSKVEIKALNLYKLCTNFYNYDEQNKKMIIKDL